MIVLDASVVLDFLLDAGPGAPAILRRVADAQLASPHLVDVEVTQVLRRLTAAGKLSESRASRALEELQLMQLFRYEHHPLLQRVFALRHNFTAYDALYVALAESLGATLLTRDARLAAAAGQVAQVI